MVAKVEYVECEVVKRYKYNGIFGWSPEHRGATARALKRLEEGNINLFEDVPLGRRVDCNYCTYFGPIFHGPWLIYKQSRENTCKAFTRLTNCRTDPSSGEPSLDFEMEMQKRNMKASSIRTASPLLRPLHREIKRRLNTLLADLEDVLTVQGSYASIIHPKRKIREEAWRQLEDSGFLDKYFTESTTGKMKGDERGKPGKYPRWVGDYSTAGSLLGGLLCELSKKAIDVFSSRDGFSSIFVRNATESEFGKVCERLTDPKGDLHFAYSDDSFFRFGGKFYEMDISTCDVSNGEGIFRLVTDLFSDYPQFHSVVLGCVEQCRLDHKIKDPSTRKASLRLKPKKAIEFSGTTLTTLLNQLASILIGLACHDRGVQDEDDIRSAAASVGYLVTAAERKELACVQFLKYSFWSDDNGEVKSFFNLGPVLRSFGTCHGDLPGRGDIGRRAFDWNSSVIRGFRDIADNSLVRDIAKYYDGSSEERLPYETRKHFDNGSRPYVPDHVLCTRYGVSLADIEHTRWLFRTHPHSIIKSHFVYRIFLVDYGLE